MAHPGNTSGEVTGAFMVIGMKYGRTRLDNLAVKEKTYEKANVYMTEFLQRNQSLNCTDLIRHNLSDPHALGLAREKKRFHTKCTRFVQDAAEILETLI
jgi:C_GCAxxG_C_C family probable redox protein